MKLSVQLAQEGRPCWTCPDGSAIAASWFCRACWRSACRTLDDGGYPLLVTMIDCDVEGDTWARIDPTVWDWRCEDREEND